MSTSDSWRNGTNGTQPCCRKSTRATPGTSPSISLQTISARRERAAPRIIPSRRPLHPRDRAEPRDVTLERRAHGKCNHEDTKSTLVFFVSSCFRGCLQQHQEL